MPDNPDAKRIVDYEKTVACYQTLHEVWFKFLAIMPLLVGGALVALKGRIT